MMRHDGILTSSERVQLNMKMSAACINRMFRIGSRKELHHQQERTSKDNKKKTFEGPGEYRSVAVLVSSCRGISGQKQRWRNEGHEKHQHEDPR